MTPLDLSLFQWMAAGHDPTPWLLAPARLIAVQGPWATLAIMAWAAWRRPSQRVLVFISLAACGAAVLLAHFIAATLDLPRPFVLGLSPPYIAHAARGALPSAHATVMFTAAWMFLLCQPLRMCGLALFGVAALTGWARVYVGVHFPFDIAAGLLLGLLIAAVFTGLWRLCVRSVTFTNGGKSTATVKPPSVQKV